MFSDVMKDFMIREKVNMHIKYSGLQFEHLL